MNAKKIISIFGDSIMKGLVLSSEKQRYTISDGLGINDLANHYSVEIINRSRVGFTIAKGVDMLKRKIEGGEKYDIVFLEYGGNDCDFRWNEVAANPNNEHIPATPIDIFRETYFDIINYLRSKSIKPVMANLPPICSERYLNWVCRDGLDRNNILTWLGDANAIYRYQEMYSREVEKIASETSTPLVNFRDAFLKHRQIGSLICDDGIHPSPSGQKIIKETLTSVMENWKTSSVAVT